MTLQPQDNRRTLPVKNSTSETIPGYALMSVTDTEIQEGQVIWVVGKPDATAEAENNRASIIINGPVAIPAGRYGVGTQDLPCQVLHDSTDTVAIGEPLGVKDGSWYAWAGYGASSMLSDDPSNAVNGGGSDANAETLWVSPGVGFKPLIRFTLAAALATSDASKAATVTDQYGAGAEQVTTASGITVYNLETSTASTYVFEGDSGDAGYARWDYGTRYQIIQMECP